MRNSLFKRVTSLLLCGLVLLAFAAGGKDTPKPEKREPEPIQVNPHAYNCFLEETMGEKIHQAYDNMIDAVLEGKDSFACPDEETYNWMFYQVPYLCFPVVYEYIDNNELEERYADGVGYLHYKIPVEEFLVKLDEFEKLITDILNTAVRSDYTDFEKMAALYNYVCENYTYDYEAFNLMYHEFVDYIGAYHFFTAKTDVCQGISTAYSYLLMQVGIDACVVKGGDHQWSIVRYNGKNYHIDPTFAMNDNHSMKYFLMDDAQRTEAGYSPKDYTYFSVYTKEHPHGDYSCNDNSYSVLWDYWFDSLDHDAHKLVCFDSSDPSLANKQEFDTKDF